MNGPPPKPHKPNTILLREGQDPGGRSFPWVGAIAVVAVIAFLVFGLWAHNQQSARQERATIERVYEQGYGAGEVGGPTDANPYSGAFGSKRLEAIWLDGWIDGKKATR